MGKYFRSSYYCPDDKDIYDFLVATNANTDCILGFLRRLGIFASSADPKEQLREYASLLYYDWSLSNVLADTATVRDLEEHSVSRDVKWDGDFNSLRDSLTAVEEKRKDRNRELYSIYQSGNTITLKVTYVDIESAKTRMLQEREKDLTIEIQATQNGFHLRMDSNKRSHAVVADILKEITPDEAEASAPEVDGISLDLVATAAGRVDFFNKMMNGIDKLHLREVIHIKMEKLQIEEDVADADDDNGEDPAVNDDVEETLQKIIFYGRNLFRSTEFTSLVSKGYFIANATWRAEVKDEKREHIELTAGFTERDDAEDFEYKVLGLYRRDDAGDLRAIRERVPGPETRVWLERIETGAKNALAEVLKSQEAIPSNEQD
jgi:hypothetical protein